MKRTRSNRCYDNKRTPSPVINPYHLAFATPTHAIHILNPMNGIIENRLNSGQKHIKTLLPLHGGHLAALSRDALCVWNVQNKSFVELKCQLPSHYSIFPMIELSKTQLIVQKCEPERREFIIVIWDYHIQTTIELRGHTYPIGRMILLKRDDSKSKLLATASLDRTVRVWNTMTGTQCFFLHNVSIIVDMIELHDGRLAFTTKTGSVHLWRYWCHPNPTQVIQNGVFIDCWIHLLQLTTGQLILYGPYNYGVKLVDLLDSNSIQTIDNTPHDIRVGNVLEHNHWIISLSFNKMKFYNLQTQEQIKYIVNEIIFIQLISNNRLVLGSRDMCISIWNMTNLDAPPHTVRISFVPFAIRELTDGQLLISSRSSVMKHCILDVATEKKLIRTTTSNVPTIRTQTDRDECYNYVHDIFKDRLFPDLCDIISEFLVDSKICMTHKRQKT